MVTFRYTLANSPNRVCREFMVSEKHTHKTLLFPDIAGKVLYSERLRVVDCSCNTKRATHERPGELFEARCNFFLFLAIVILLFHD